MSIRFIDIQTSVTASNQVSDFKQRQQQIQNLHQTHPQGQTEESQRKLTEEVNEVDADTGVDPDGKNKEEQEAQKRQQEQEQNRKDESRKSSRINDGTRGHKLDFSV